MSTTNKDSKPNFLGMAHLKTGTEAETRKVLGNDRKILEVWIGGSKKADDSERDAVTVSLRWSTKFREWLENEASPEAKEEVMYMLLESIKASLDPNQEYTIKGGTTQEIRDTAATIGKA